MKNTLAKPFRSDELKKPEYYRRLLCGKIRKKNYDEFISTLQALGFKKLKYEFFGKRKSFVMFSKEIDDAYRLHLRIYDLDDTIYVLAHKEPKTADISFHVKGFVARMRDFFKNYGSTSEEMDFRKKEMADYQAGTQVFKDLILQKVPNLAKKIDFEITENDLSAFSAKFGEIDHLSTADLVLENLLDASDNQFRIHLEAAKDIFTILGFAVEGIDLVDAKREFTAKAIYSEEPYTILVTQAAPDLQYLEKFLEVTRAKYPNAEFLLYLMPDPTTAPEFEKIAIKGKVNLITVSDLAVFFLDHTEYPFTQEEIVKLFSRSGGFIPAARIATLIAEKKENEQIFSHSLHIFEVIQKANAFLSVKEIEKLLKREGLSPDRDDIEAILSFLANPLISLVEIKKDRYKAILNKEEVKLKLKRLEETFKQLQPK